MIGAGTTTPDGQAAMKTEQGKKRQEDQGEAGKQGESSASHAQVFYLHPNA